MGTAYRFTLDKILRSLLHFQLTWSILMVQRKCNRLFTVSWTSFAMILLCVVRYEASYWRSVYWSHRRGRGGQKLADTVRRLSGTGYTHLNSCRVYYVCHWYFGPSDTLSLNCWLWKAFLHYFLAYTPTHMPLLYPRLQPLLVHLNSSSIDCISVNYKPRHISDKRQNALQSPITIVSVDA